jgi:hypothetical protein
MNWQMMLANHQRKTNKNRKTAAKRFAAGSGGMMHWRFAFAQQA